MKETRLEKYRNYRRSLNEMKQNSQTEEIKQVREERIVSASFNTTTTLPLDEVLGKLDEKQKSVVIKTRKKKSAKFVLLTIMGILLLVGIGIFAFIAFGGN